MPVIPYVERHPSAGAVAVDLDPPGLERHVAQAEARRARAPRRGRGAAARPVAVAA